MTSSQFQMRKRVGEECPSPLYTPHLTMAWKLLFSFSSHFLKNIIRSETLQFNTLLSVSALSASICAEPCNVSLIPSCLLMLESYHQRLPTSGISGMLETFHLIDKLVLGNHQTGVIWSQISHLIVYILNPIFWFYTKGFSQQNPIFIPKHWDLYNFPNYFWKSVWCSLGFTQVPVGELSLTQLSSYI